MGFWSTLANIGATATGFGGLFKAGEALGGLIAGGGNKSAPTAAPGSPTSPSSSGLLENDPIIQDLMKRAQKTSDFGLSTVGKGLNTLGQAKGTLGQAESSYARLASGDRDTLMDELQPEISTVLTQYDTAAKTAAKLTPRGGGRNELLAETPYKKIGAVESLLPKARAEGRAGLADVGAKEASIGASEASIGANLASGQGNVLSSVLQSKYQDKQLAQLADQYNRSLQQTKDTQSQNMWKDIGSSVGGFLIDLLKNKGKGGN